LPARSVTPPDTVDTPSVVTSWSAGQAPGAMPEVASLQVKCTVTAVLSQPARFGTGSTDAEIDGGV